MHEYVATAVDWTSNQIASPPLPQTLETLWRVQFPDGYWVSLAGGNVREVGSTK